MVKVLKLLVIVSFLSYLPGGIITPNSHATVVHDGDECPNMEGTYDPATAHELLGACHRARTSDYKACEGLSAKKKQECKEEADCNWGNCKAEAVRYFCEERPIKPCGDPYSDLGSGR